MSGEGSNASFSMKMVINTLKTRWPGVKTMSTADLSQRLTQPQQLEQQTDTPPAADGGTTKSAAASGGIMVLDARPIEEYDVSHVEGAVRVHPDGKDVMETANLVQDKGIGTVVCYCALGYRSSSYAQALQTALKDKGLTDDVAVYNLEGSLMQWANEGRPMVDIHGAATPYCHPYSAVWGKLLKADLRRTTPSPPS